MKVEQELSAIKQELKDLKDIVTDIREQTRKTNGTVAKCMTDIAVLQNNNSNVKENRDWSMRSVVIILGIITLGINIIFFVINHYGG